jgi:heat shock 70kDa protein 4
MLLVLAKQISESANAGATIGDAVLAVPHWFTNSQRRGMLQAAELAQLNVLKVTNETNAIALSFGIFKSAKKLFSETESTYVLFCDLGYTGFSATVVAFKQEHMTVLSTVCERGVSGRDFDDAVVEHLAAAFQKKTGLDVRHNVKAMLKLQTAAEKAKKTLSPLGVSEAAVSVECIADDRDLNATLTRVDFEACIAPLVDKLRSAVTQCLAEAGISAAQLAETEIVGGSTRVGLVKKVLGEALGLDTHALNHGLKTTMNADEAVARGAALQCAMLSSRMKVKPFVIVDRMNYGVEAVFEEHGESKTVAIYARNDELPHKPRRITFRNKTEDFNVSLFYDNAAIAFLPPGESRFIGKYHGTCLFVDLILATTTTTTTTLTYFGV